MTPTKLRGIRAGLSRVLHRFRALSNKDRRALLIGGLILIPPLLWIGVARPWMEAVAETRETVLQEAELLARERSLLQRGPTLPSDLGEARLQLKRKGARLLQSGNAALAEAAIAKTIEEIARANNSLLLEVRSTGRPRGEPEPPGLLPLRLNVRVESDFQGLLGFLHAMESDPLLIRLVGFSMDRGDGATMTLTSVIEAYAPLEPLGTTPDESADQAGISDSIMGLTGEARRS